MADRFFKVVEIEAKNFGCVAIKEIPQGNLILQEQPQCVAQWSDPEYTHGGVNSLLIAYSKMNASDQIEFLKLHNRFKVDNHGEKNPELLKRQSQLKEWIHQNNIKIPNNNNNNNHSNNSSSDMVLNIIGIYDTNCFQKGVGIRTARFNHSCCSNAEAIWNEEENVREIRAITRIYPGDEISINYGWKQISMKNLKMRQNFLLANWGFQCSCRLCQYEKLNHPDEEKYENFAKLQQQSKKLLEVAKTAGQVRLAIIKKEVTCYKEMYKLAEQKNCSKAFIVNEILDNGFNAAVQGYLQAQVTFNYNSMAEFETECELFSYHGEEMARIVFGNNPIGKEWKERKNNFENWIKEDMIEKHFQLHTEKRF